MMKLDIPRDRLAILVGAFALVIGWVLFGPRIYDLIQDWPAWARYLSYAAIVAIIIAVEVAHRHIKSKKKL
jgi:hypothetical protein